MNPDTVPSAYMETTSPMQSRDAPPTMSVPIMSLQGLWLQAVDSQDLQHRHQCHNNYQDQEHFHLI